MGFRLPQTLETIENVQSEPQLPIFNNVIRQYEIFHQINDELATLFDVNCHVNNWLDKLINTDENIQYYINKKYQRHSLARTLSTTLTYRYACQDEESQLFELVSSAQTYFMAHKIKIWFFNILDISWEVEEKWYDNRLILTVPYYVNISNAIWRETENKIIYLINYGI